MKGQRFFALSSVAFLLSIWMLALIPFSSANFGESGWAGSEILNPDETLFCDFETSKLSGDPHQFISGDPGAIYPSAQANAYWETNDSYCYWGNATDNTGWKS